MTVSSGPGKTDGKKSDRRTLTDLLTQEEPPVSDEGKSVFLRVLDSLYLAFFNYFRIVGLFCFRFWLDAKKRTSRFYQRHLKKQVYRLERFWLRLVKRFSHIKKAVLFQFYLFLKFFADAWRVVKSGYLAVPEKSFWPRLCSAARAFFRGVRNNTRVFRTFFNYALPVVGVAVLAHLVAYVFSLNFAVSVEYNGEHVGYVQNEAVYEQAEAKLHTRLLYQSTDEVMDTVPRFAVTVVEPTELKTDTQLTDTIIESSNANIVEATGITVDGTFLGAVKNGAAISDRLNKMLDKYKTNKPGERVEFTKDVKLESGLYLQGNLTDEEGILRTLTSNSQQNVYYTVVAGDAPSTIAEKNSMTLTELQALNPDVLTNCPVGRQLLINKSEPYLPVKSIRTEVYTTTIPFDTKYTMSNSLYEGQAQVTVQGQSGKQSVTAEVSYVDGVEIGRKILSTSVVTNPVTKVVAKGTRVMPKVSGNLGPTSNYGFIWPVNSNGYYVSQNFGRYGHRGIDIAFRGNGYGTPIMAALPGTVTFAGRSGSFGNLVVVSHGNGLETYYAHCSRLRVSAGETVKQGQLIGNVGSTGNSTGNHLHFEVHVNGRLQNPRSYLP